MWPTAVCSRQLFILIASLEGTVLADSGIAVSSRGGLIASDARHTVSRRSKAGARSSMMRHEEWRLEPSGEKVGGFYYEDDGLYHAAKTPSDNSTDDDDDNEHLTDLAVNASDWNTTTRGPAIRPMDDICANSAGMKGPTVTGPCPADFDCKRIMRDKHGDEYNVTSHLAECCCVHNTVLDCWECGCVPGSCSASSCKYNEMEDACSR
mmetsp:Transcript_106027/g.167437  ORF Transcript_106027/g.167437 Transcript_106027/m.167437 type:complete len:208 (-) Transcript_106027:64-687(-)